MKTFKVLLIIFLTITEISCTQESSQIKSIVNINMEREIGIIRPLHGGTLGPVSMLKTLDLTDYYKECKIPLIRLEAVTWFNTNAVDIQTIFHDLRDDPSKADNYDFRQTDDYMTTVIKTGAEIIYRLGNTIEFGTTKFYIDPPEDYEKFAAICCGIIRHYNEGWANGFHYNIKYWEIWNEPDLIVSDKPGNWTGTHEQYIQLYDITAKTIKKNFPYVKVGGPASGGPFRIENGTTVASDFTNNFLSYCQKNSVPLDFYSWHRYGSTPTDISPCPAIVRNYLNQYGFTKTESILDEWNYWPKTGYWSDLKGGIQRVKFYDEQTSAKGGAFIASVLMLLQDEPLDGATIFTSGNGAFGLFSDLGVPHKYYYAFRAFSELVNNTPVRLETQYSKEDSLVICSGTNKEKTEVAILVSNFNSTAKMVDFELRNNFLEGNIAYELYAVDETHSFSKVKSYEIKNSNVLNITKKVNGSSVLLLKLVSEKYKQPQ
jgi:xylan 1,4-beta-xylosidase